MDPNLTQPIILNATLIQSPQPLWKDWLPAIVSLVVVISGTFGNYLVNKILERNRFENEARRLLRDERKILYVRSSPGITSNSRDWGSEDISSFRNKNAIKNIKRTISAIRLPLSYATHPS